MIVLTSLIFLALVLLLIVSLCLLGEAREIETRLTEIKQELSDAAILRQPTLEQHQKGTQNEMDTPHPVGKVLVLCPRKDS